MRGAEKVLRKENLLVLIGESCNKIAINVSISDVNIFTSYIYISI